CRRADPRGPPLRRGRPMKALAACALVACGGTRYLGAPAPAECRDGDPERCAGWLAERDLAAGALDVYDEHGLRAYVQSIADRLGYAPFAMTRALSAELEADDDEHPARVDRIARVATLADARTGFEGRRELLEHVDHMVAGRDTRLGVELDGAWVIAVLGVAL